MATRTICDGTGIPIPNDTPTTGLLGRQYCAEAREHAERYLDDVNTIHTESAAAFQSKLTALRERYRDQLLHLPDEA